MLSPLSYKALSQVVPRWTSRAMAKDWALTSKTTLCFTRWVTRWVTRTFTRWFTLGLSRCLSRWLHASWLVLSVVPLAISLFAVFAEAAILIPENLNQEDRQSALKILALGSSSKLLSSPYPLGGDLGFEVGISIENLPVDEIGRLGSELPAPQQSVSFPKFSIGKGLYNDVDVFLQFTPYTRQDELSQFGGLLRWGFHEASFLPIYTSFVFHFNAGNIGNALTTRSYGFDLVSGITAAQVGLYAGVGLAEATGHFIGGAASLTDSGLIETETVSDLHLLLGANIRFSKFFIALQLDRYSIPVFSGKLGLRF